MNLAEVHILRKTDERAEQGLATIIETQFGDVRVEPIMQGNVATLEMNGKTLIETDKIASVAFLKLADKINSIRLTDSQYSKFHNFIAEANEVVRRENVFAGDFRV